MKKNFRQTYFGKDCAILSVTEPEEESNQKYRFLNICKKQNILLGHVTMVSPHQFQCVAKRMDLEEIFRIGEKTKVSVRICENRGFCYYLRHRKSHYVFFLLMALLIGLLYFSQQFIWRIEVQGNNTIAGEEILSFLEENGVSLGTPFQQYDFSELELLLRAHYDNVIWTSLQREGTTLVVSLKENEFGQKLEETMSSPYLGTTIVLDEDGTILSYFVRKGVPLLEETGYAGAGTKLVSGNVPVYDAFSGELLSYEPVIPDADILLETNLNYHYSCRNYAAGKSGGIRFLDRVTVNGKLLAELWNYRNTLELQGMEILDYSYSFREKDFGNGRYELSIYCNFHVIKNARVHYEDISPQEGTDTAS